MRKLATSRESALNLDLHSDLDVHAKRQRHTLPTKESSIAWSLHDGNVAFAADS